MRPCASWKMRSASTLAASLSTSRSVSRGAMPSSTSRPGPIAETCSPATLTEALETRWTSALIGVYNMRMARVNVYLPDEMAREARAAGLNLSRVAQDAVRGELARRATDTWLDELARLPSVEIPHERVIESIDEARAEIGQRASA